MSRPKQILAWLLAALTACLAVVVAPPAATADIRPAAGQFVPLTPARVVNDRSLAANTGYPFSPLGLGGVPASGVSAVSLLISTRSTGSGVIIAYPAGITQPVVSNLNYRPNLSTTNSAVIRLGTGNQVAIYNQGAAATRLYVDVVGYFKLAGGTAGSTYVPLQPARIAVKQPVAAGGSTLVNPLGKGGVPTANVSAVVANLIVQGAAPGVATAWPDGVAQPPTSDLNYQGDWLYNNQITVKLGANGQFRVGTTTAADVWVDVVGYYQSPAGTAAGSTFAAVNPSRMFTEVIVPSGGVYPVAPLGQGGIPAGGVSAVAFNLTAVARTSSTGVLAVYPSGAANPLTNQISYRPGGHWPVLLRSKLGADGKVNIHNSGAGEVRIFLDLAGYYLAPTAPGAPTGVGVTVADKQTTVTWTPPAGDGGAAITGYRITANPGGTTLDVTNTTAAIFAGLTNGTAYTFTVAARNAVGQGAQSAASASVTPKAATAPGAPTGVTTTVRDRSALVRWTPPANDGGAGVDSYTVTATPGGATATVTAPDTTALVSGLTNGTAYTFTVKATNAVGAGAASAASAATTPAATVPDAPTHIEAGSAGNGGVTVEWYPPKYAGGSAVTGYVLTVQPGGRTVTTAAGVTGTTVTGLTSGTAYTFTVAARNGIGAGAASVSSKPVKPDLVYKAGARELTAAEEATLNGGGATSLIFTNAPASITSLTAGTVLVVSKGVLGSPDGSLRRVVSVATSGTRTTVTTSQAALADAFAAGDISMDGDTSDTGGTGTQFDLNPTYTITLSLDKEIIPKVKTSGTVKIALKPGFHVDLGTGETNISFEATTTIDVKAKAEVNVVDLKGSKELGGGGKFSPAKLLRIKPTLIQQFYLTGSAKLGANSEIGIKASATQKFTVNVNSDKKNSFDASWQPGVILPLINVQGTLSLGLRMDISAMALGIKMAALRINAPRFDATFSPLTAPSVLLKGCVTVGVAAAADTWVKDDIFAICQDIYRNEALQAIVITPRDSWTTRKGTVTLKAQSRYANNEFTWTVDGGDENGKVDNGVFTAPDKDGEFRIKVTNKASLGRPPEEGWALVHVGTPNLPSAQITTQTHSTEGLSRIRITIDAPTGGAAVDSYRAYVKPNEQVDSLCGGYWNIPSAGSFNLSGGLDGRPEFPCNTLIAGRSVTLEVTAINQYGESPRGVTNAVVVT